MNKLLRKFPLLAALSLSALAFSPPSAAQQAQPAAQEEESPDKMVQRITKEVMEIARTDRGIKSGNRERIHELVEARILPHLDFRRATALTMGRYWRRATPEQREQVTNEFRSLMIHTYAGALSQVGDQKLQFKPFRDNPDDNEVEVHFQVERPRGGEPVAVSYRLYHAKNGWKVYDVNVLGVWLSETYRSSFSAEIQRSGIEGLIRTLSEKNKRLAASRSGGIEAS